MKDDKFLQSQREIQILRTDLDVCILYILVLYDAQNGEVPIYDEIMPIVVSFIKEHMKINGFYKYKTSIFSLEDFDVSRKNRFLYDFYMSSFLLINSKKKLKFLNFKDFLRKRKIPEVGVFERIQHVINSAKMFN